MIRPLVPLNVFQERSFKSRLSAGSDRLHKFLTVIIMVLGPYRIAAPRAVKAAITLVANNSRHTGDHSAPHTCMAYSTTNMVLVAPRDGSRALSTSLRCVREP